MIRSLARLATLLAVPLVALPPTPAAAQDGQAPPAAHDAGPDIELIVPQRRVLVAPEHRWAAAS